MAISKVLDYKNLLAGFMIILVCLLTGCSAKIPDDLDCGDLGDMAMGTIYDNVKIVEIYTNTTTEKSRSPKQLVCKTDAIVNLPTTQKTGNSWTKPGDKHTITMIYQMDKNGDGLFSWEISTY